MCHPFSFRNERSDPPHCRCHQKTTLSSATAEENCLVEGHTSFQSSPHLMRDPRAGRGIIPAQSLSEGPSHSRAPCGLGWVLCGDFPTCSSAYPASFSPLPQVSSKDRSLMNTLLASLRVCSPGIQPVTETCTL